MALERNCGLAVSGTNSEANSLSVDERIQLLEAGLDTKRIGTGLPSDSDDGRVLERAYAKIEKIGKRLASPRRVDTFSIVRGRVLCRNRTYGLQRVGVEPKISLYDSTLIV